MALLFPMPLPGRATFVFDILPLSFWIRARGCVTMAPKNDSVVTVAWRGAPCKTADGRRRAACHPPLAIAVLLAILDLWIEAISPVCFAIVVHHHYQ